MSDLPAPLVHSVRTIGQPSDPVNLENCKSIASFDKPSIDGRNEPARYTIVFSWPGEGGAGSPNYVEWKYETETARDTDLAAILSRASFPLP